MQHRESEIELFRRGKTEQLTSRVHSRMNGLVQAICGRLVGMGACSAQCPCAEYSHIGMTWLEDEISESLNRQVFDDDGKLVVVLVEDDFRRRWNRARGLKQEPLNHKLLRRGIITDWGSRFLESLRANEWLQECSPNDDVRLLRLAESWLRHLWDDASDNADMISIRKGDFSEFWYVHPEQVWLNDTKRRYGYRADRVYRRRISDVELREMDVILPENVRPTFTTTGKAAESNEFHKVAKFCDALFVAVESADAQVERYQVAPDASGPNTSESQYTAKIETFGITTRQSKSGKLEISTDDLDRLSDGIVDELNPRALFDDFASAWAMTRINSHEAMTVLDQPRNAPAGSRGDPLIDRTATPEHSSDDDCAERHDPDNPNDDDDRVDLNEPEAPIDPVDD